MAQYKVNDAGDACARRTGDGWEPFERLSDALGEWYLQGEWFRRDAISDAVESAVGWSAAGGRLTLRQ